MIINFYPESDNPDFEKAAKEYAQIWKEEGEKIATTIEKISGLKFKEKVINALTFADVSYSVPLQLSSSDSLEEKKAGLVHELCHRLIVGNDIKLKGEVTNENWNLKVHKQVDLIIYDAWVELYGKDFANRMIESEINLWTGEGISPYKIAWDWALAMTKEQRAEEFKKYLR